MAPADMPFSTFIMSGYAVSAGDEVGRQQVLQPFRRHAPAVQVAVVEGDQTRWIRSSELESRIPECRG